MDQFDKDLALMELRSHEMICAFHRKRLGVKSRKVYVVGPIEFEVVQLGGDLPPSLLVDGKLIPLQQS